METEFEETEIVTKASVAAVKKAEKEIEANKKIKKAAKKHEQFDKTKYYNVIMGIGQLFVVVSIAYSTSVVLMGIDSVVSKIILFPQVVFATYILLKAFSGLYK